MHTMKKILLTVLMGLCISNTFVAGAGHVITSDDFEGYSLTEQYNTESLTVSYEGMSSATLTDRVIVNAPGGIFTGEDAYEGNAAANILSYAKTGDGTAVAVPGNLNNGWLGLYSHPMQKLQGGGGASSELNQWNRRLAVIKDGSDKMLKFNPAKNGYVHTHSTYSYESIDFSTPVQWDSDVKIKTVGGSPFVLALTKGRFSNVTLLTYPSRENGRTGVTDFIEFTSDLKIKIWGEEKGSYVKDTFYTVSVFFDVTVQPAKMKVTVKNSADSTVAAETELMDTEFDFSGVTGVEYAAVTKIQDEDATDVYVDNINIYKVVYEPSVSGNTNVKIDDTGAVILDFPTKYDPATVTEATVTVNKGMENVVIKEIKKQNSNRRIRILLPELDPTSKYTININGVTNLEGIVCQWTGEFRTVDLVSVSGAVKTSDGVTYTIKNNSKNPSAVTVIAVMYKDRKIVSNGVAYKRVSLNSAETKNETFVGMAGDADSVSVYVLDGIQNFRAITVPAEN